MVRTARLMFVSLLLLAAAPAEAGQPSPRARTAQRRGRQVRKAREEIARAVELERGALAGTSQTPASDLFRAEALRARARARLRLVDGLVDRGITRSVRDHIKDARRQERQARQVDGDPGAQVLFRQTLLDAQGERAYWQRQGAYGYGRGWQPPRKAVSRSRPRVKVRQVEYLQAASAARAGRERARDRQAVRDAAQPSARPQMIRSRALRFYTSAFGPSFERRLAEMSASETWIDVGAGSGQALAGYAAARPDGARLIAVDLIDDASRVARRLPDGRMRVVAGDVTEVEVGEKAQLLTDVFAALSYGDAPDRVMQRYGELLAPGGQAMIFLEEQRNTILARDGRTGEDLIGYLRRVDGFAVEDVRAFDQGTAVLLRRTAGPVRAPRLELLEFKDGGPPTRVFRMRADGDLSAPLRSRFVPMRRGR